MDQFLASFVAPPHWLTFDIDPFDDPTHGQQQLTFYHGYYELPSRDALWRPETSARDDLERGVQGPFSTVVAAPIRWRYLSVDSP
jgi:hypothetical protein